MTNSQLKRAVKQLDPTIRVEEQIYSSKIDIGMRAPDGKRFPGGQHILVTHWLVGNFRDARQDAFKDLKNNLPLEDCPVDCPCKEVAILGEDEPLEFDAVEDRTQTEIRTVCGPVSDESVKDFINRHLKLVHGSTVVVDTIGDGEFKFLEAQVGWLSCKSPNLPLTVKGEVGALEAGTKIHLTIEAFGMQEVDRRIRAELGLSYNEGKDDAIPEE